MGVSKNQEKAITALLSESKLKDAANVAGISESTLWRWLKEEEFQKAYMQARRESVRHSVAQLQQTSGEAVGVLREVMMDKNSSASARVTAAKSVLELSIKAVEFEDLEMRLIEVESLLAKVTK